MRATWLAPLLLLPALSSAIEFEAKSSAKVTYEGTVAVVDLPDVGRYYVNEVPKNAAVVSQLLELPKKYQSKATLALTMGDAMSSDEVQAVLDAWYHETAVDYGSLKIRDLKVGERRYVVACMSESVLATCIGGQIFAGTVVTYEINGANRSGGMTGYQPRTIVIRKEPASPAP